MSERLLPRVIQGGMGIGVSNWVLARAVSLKGQLGVVSGTGIAIVAARRLLEAMRIALPHGFITPFAEPVSDFGGLVEKCLEEEFPHCSNAVIEQWKCTVKNWITFNNHFTRDNITLILSLRESHLAQLVASHVPYAKIAKQFNISVGRLKNIMLEIYEKLCISGRDELAQYVLMKSKGAEL